MVNEENQVTAKGRTKELATIGITSISSTAPEGSNRVV